MATTLDPGSTVPYIITGVNSDDISGASLSGEFVIGSDGTSDLNLIISNDASAENDKLTLSLPTTENKESITVNILDVPGVIATYNVSIDNAPSSINEGNYFTVTCSSRGTLVYDTVPFTLSGINTSDLLFKGHVPASKITDLNGKFQLIGGEHKLRFWLKEDLSDNEGQETLTLTILPNLATSATVCRQFNFDIKGNVLFIGDDLFARKTPFFEYSGGVPTRSKNDFDLIPEIIASSLGFSSSISDRISTPANRILATKILDSDGLGIIIEGVRGYRVGDMLANIGGPIANAGGKEGIKCVVISAGLYDFTDIKGIASPVDNVYKDNPASTTKVKNRLKNTILEFINYNIDVILLGVPYIGTGDFTLDNSYLATTGLPFVPNPVTEGLVDHPMYAELAAETGCIYIPDIYRQILYSGNPITTATSLLVDAIHPNQDGMHYYANRILEFMQRLYNKQSITLSSPKFPVSITPSYYTTPIVIYPEVN